MKIHHQEKNKEKNRMVSMIHKKEQKTTLLAKSFASAIPETPHRKCERRNDNMDSSSTFNTTNSTTKNSVFC